jgi:hypothetical protein
VGQAFPALSERYQRESKGGLPDKQPDGDGLSKPMYVIDHVVHLADEEGKQRLARMLLPSAERKRQAAPGEASDRLLL